ncbi:DUF590-domain-containing protein [Violaceomyces palustris]|uniref:DUF590-domain-containing protein n=1 Tax=Violaceomyces palustris TaxID=1673888 RepID=A0ACD0NYX2_9BASI|nr:DUF590-domain-containing protein [Violaceomyces palustris]
MNRELANKQSPPGQSGNLSTNPTPPPVPEKEKLASPPGEKRQDGTLSDGTVLHPSSSLKGSFNDESEGRGKDPQVDYLLVFQAVPIKNIRSKTRVPSTEKAKISNEYSRIIARIRSVGLNVTSRNAQNKAGTVLLFVKAPLAVLNQFAAHERLNDHLHGVFSPNPSLEDSSPSVKGKEQQQPPLETFTPATRIRYVHALLTSPPVKTAGGGGEAGEKGDPGSQPSSVPGGAGLVIKSSEFPHLVDMTPLHDPAYNSAWLKNWAKVSSPRNVLFGIGASDLDSIKDHFGEEIALYFGYLNFYFQALGLVALWGLGFWMAGKPYSVTYSIGLVIWNCVLVEGWRVKEKKLAVRWGTLGVDGVETRRNEFVPRTTRLDPVTGEEEEVFEWWRRELRMLVSLPVMALFASLLAMTMTLTFTIEVFVSHLYDGPGKSVVPLIPTALFVGLVPQIMQAWQATASALTRWENHKSSRSHEKWLTLKVFALQAMVAYGALTLSALVYIPFGESIMEDLVRRGWFRQSIRDVTTATRERVEFKVDASRMHSQLFAASVTSQVINAMTELVVPVLMRKVAEWKKGSGGDVVVGQGKKEKEEEEEEETKWLKRVESELELAEYDVFGDHAEMATQLGFISLWSVIWPLSPVMGLVNNFFELRSDAAKICLNHRRPRPARVESIGAWLWVITSIACLSSLSNSALVYLFQPSPVVGEAGTTTMRKDPPGSDGKSKIITSLLIATTFQQLHYILTSLIRHLFQKLDWEKSQESHLFRRSQWRKKKSETTLLLLPTSSDELGPSTSPAEEFWNREKDRGLEDVLGERHLKLE